MIPRTSMILILVMLALLLIVSACNSVVQKQITNEQKLPVSFSPTPIPVIATATNPPVNPSPSPLRTAEAQPSGWALSDEATFVRQFPGIQWSTPRAQSMVAYRELSAGTLSVQGYHIESNQLNTYPDGFVAYFQQGLVNRGWTQTMAAGSGMSGNFWGFAKSGRYITFGVWTARQQAPYQLFVDFSQ